MLTILLFSLLSASSFAKTPVVCANALSLENVEGLVLQTRDHYFPELSATSIRAVRCVSRAYFLQAQPFVKSLTKRRSERRYKVEVNDALLACPPSIEALEAIIVHELEHIRDYTGWSTGRLLRHGIDYSLSFKQKVDYEHATDRKVLSKGLHEGLAQYREWVYQQLTPKDLITKRRIYLTPEEIRSSL